MRFTRSTAWKLAGIAGAVGVAATGVLVARSERQRRAYTPDEVRDRLHERYAQATDPPHVTAAPRRPLGQRLRGGFHRARDKFKRG